MHTVATTKGQIVIPATLRKKHGIKKGTRILVSEQEDRIILRPVTAKLVDRLRGKYKGSGMLQALIEERARDRQRENGRRPRV